MHFTVNQGINRRRYKIIAVLRIAIVTMPFLPSVFGQAETVVSFDASRGQLPEGVAVDNEGSVFVGFAPLGEIVKVEVDSDTAEPFASVEGFMEGDTLLGLAADTSGNVYAAVASSNANVNGVWQFDAETGDGNRIEGTDTITFANAMAFDESGTMYITDTILGAVWRVEEGASAELWLQDPLLEGDGSVGFGFPIGANGVAVGPDALYVGVSEAGAIVAMPIMDDGSAGEASVWATMPEGAVPDGITIDMEGNIYVAAPFANEVLRVNVDGSIETLATQDDGLDAPSSVACSIIFDECQSIYAVNFSVAIAPPGGAGPALLMIDAGEVE